MRACRLRRYSLPPVDMRGTKGSTLIRVILCSHRLDVVGHFIRSRGRVLSGPPQSVQRGRFPRLHDPVKLQQAERFTDAANSFSEVRGRRTRLRGVRV